MMHLYLLLILAVFILFGFDIRKKPAAKTFVPLIFIILMKASCVLLFTLYVWSIYTITTLHPLHYATAVFTTVGALLVMWAKITLGGSFTWTGYHLTNAQIVTHGPYKYVKHPLYYGVFLVEIGALITYILAIYERENFTLLFALGAIPMVYAVGFNLIMARKETLNIQALRKGLPQ